MRRLVRGGSQAAVLASAALVVVDAPLPAIALLGVAAASDARPVRPADLGTGGGMPVSVRLAVRSLVLAAAGAALWTSEVHRSVALALAAVVVVVAGVDAVDGRVQGLRRHPAARGIAGLEPLTGVRRPPAVLLTAVPEFLVGGAAVLFPSRPVPVLLAGLVAVAVAAGVAATWFLRVRRGRADLPRRLRVAQAALDELRPAVVLYSGDGPGSVHEVASWLPALERLDVATLVLARDRATLAALPATTVPLLCVPGTVDLQSLRWDAAQIVLFTSNIANNIHALRLRGVRTAFVGHGDSDKGASANPFSRVYDEIWVAGPAGRDRYTRADLGVRPDAVVEIGRPQLAPVRQRTGTPPAVPTLLYAPTWEGWDDESDHSSLTAQGEALVRAVLASPTPVRLVYRPHPYPGRRSPAVAAAHRRIVALLRAANEAAGYGSATLPAARPTGDAPQSAAERERLDVAAGEARIAALPAGASVLVEPGAVPLASCLNACDGLVTDVSSVLSDHLATDKPLAVCDSRGIGPDRFVDRYPAAAAGPVLPPDLTGLASFLAVVRGDSPDEHAARRAAVRRSVLGPERFAAAVDALARRSRNAQSGPTSPTADRPPVPGGAPCVQSSPA